MADEKQEHSSFSYDKEKFVFGFDSMNRPEVMIFTIPILKLAEEPNGTATVRGMFDEVKAMAINEMRKIRAAKNQNGLIHATKGLAQ